MNIKLIKVKFGNCAGSALAHIYGPERKTMYDRRPYLAVHLTYVLKRDPPESATDHPNTIILPIEGEMPFLRVDILLDPPRYSECEYKWPDATEIRDDLAQAISKIVSAAMQLYGPGYEREVYANTVAL